MSELAVARGLGQQAVVASICPRSNDKADDDYGYRPAIRAIADRLESVLGNPCLPRPLVADPEGKVACVILETLGLEIGQAGACNPANGLKEPDPGVVARFRKRKAAEGIDLSKLPICEVVQLTRGQLVDGSCTESPAAGWCYVTGASAGGACPQAIKFSTDGSPKNGATISVQCAEPAAW